jgi:Mannosyltransferase (PIG-V)
MVPTAGAASGGGGSTRVTVATRRSSDDRTLLAVWSGTRVAVALLAFASAWMVADAAAGDVPSWLAGWDRWDAQLFVKVARFGYDGYPQHYPDKGIVAFFPGEPLLLRAVHVVVRNWVASGLVISAVAGAFASVALGRLGAREGGREAGRRAVVYLTLSPYAVFLAAGYSEALFLAFALWSWLFGKERRWVAAGVLGGAASAVRVTGVFLGAGLVVEWLLHRDGRRWRDLVPLALPFAAVGGYFVYLHGLTGDWLAWSHAQASGWGRHLTSPWHALRTTWDSATGVSTGNAYTWSFRAEIAAVVLGVVLCVALLVLRRWSELVYVGLQVVALATSSFYLSVARATLLWFPLWLLLAKLGTERRLVHGAYLACAPALMAVAVIAFVQGHWVG